MNNHMSKILGTHRTTLLVLVFARIWHSTQEKRVHCRAKLSDLGYDTDDKKVTVPCELRPC